MKTVKRMVALSMSILLLMSGMTGMAFTASAATETPVAEDSYYTIGSFQPEGSVASGSISGVGQLKVQVDAVKLVDITAYDPADLALQLEMRATRHDGVTGVDSLKWLRNGSLTVSDSAGTQVIKTGSPVQSGVPAAERIAGEWMTVTFSLGSMAESSGKLSSVALFDYNDFPHQGIDTGITLEVRNTRVVDTSRDADGIKRVNYEMGAFYQAEGNHASKNNQFYVDWSNANTAPIDVSADRSRYRLTMTLDFASDDAAVSAMQNWNQITVKLRSSDVTGKEGDPSGESNHEHNYGWDFKNGNTYTTMSVEGNTINLSIPLDTPSTNTRGLMDWSDVRRMICIVALKSEAASHLSVTISNARIVDMGSVADMKKQLLSVLNTEQDETLFNETDKAAYGVAKKAAQAVYDDDAALPTTIQQAMAALKAAMLASDAQKESLRTWISRKTNWDLITADTKAAYEAAVAAGQALLDATGATSAAVVKATENAKEAWFALAFDDSVEALDYGNVDGSEDGVTAADALMALQAATDKIELSEEQTMLANVDGQDAVTANDALMILQYATKKIASFPVGVEDLSSATVAVENDDPLTFTNPIDISYMFQRSRNDANRVDGQASYRESADPAIVVFKDKYYLFASHGNGYWSSPDLADWTFIEVDAPNHEDDPNFTQISSQFRRYAPATCAIGDTLYICHSEGGDMLKSKNPDDPNSWELVAKANALGGWMDPGMFYDDPATGGDGYVYLYKGLSHRNAIQVIKLDPKNNMAKVDGPYDCAWPDMLNHGFEVPGDTNTNYANNDTMEGAWPVKYNGKYYLMCAVPGTQFASYTNNCFVADSPMGPFTYCDNSPIPWKATGFTQGAGHGGLFEDLNGNWWAVQTCRIAGFERRLVLVPAIFDEDGELYANTVMTDYPMYIPTENEDPFNNMGPGWNLLSYGKDATASTNAGSASLAFNETMTNAWVAETGDVGEWLQVDLGRVYGVWSVQVNFADKGYTGMGGRDNDYAYRYLMEFSQDGETWFTMVDRTEQTDDLSHEYIEFADKIGVRYVRITNKGAVPADGKFAISGLRIFGEGGRKAPAPVDLQGVTFERREDNNRSIGIAWEAAPGAQGYIIRYGTAPDKLYTHFQVIGAENYVINSLNRGVDYYFTIDSYNESGVTLGTETFKAEATEPLQPGYDVENNNPAIVNQAKGFVTHEAETATFGGESVKVEYEVRASGAYALHGLGDTDTYVEFANVAGGTKGTATLRISYATLKASKALVKLNGQRVGELTLPKTAGWPTYATVDMNLTGVGETNTIRIEGVGEGFHLDWAQLIYEEDSEGYEPGEIIGDPMDAAPLSNYVLYEAETASYGGGATLGNDTEASGGKSIHSMEKQGSYVSFSRLDGGAGGTGILRFGYSAGSSFGEPTIYLNGEMLTDSFYKLPTTGGWGTFKAIQIAVADLKPGTTNTVRFEGGHTGFNLDYIQLLPDEKGDHYGEVDPAEPFTGIKDPAQVEGYTVYEAENAAYGNGANVANDAKASGGKSIHSMEKTDAYVEFTNVDGGVGGNARLRLAYCEGNAAGAFKLIVNGELVLTTSLVNTGDWSTFKMIEFTLENVKAGETNTIRLECGGAGYNPDWIQLIPVAAE